MNTSIDDKDKEIIKLAAECLATYHQLLAQLPEDKWLALSYSNKVIWRESESQQEFLEDVVKDGFIPEEEM